MRRAEFIEQTGLYRIYDTDDPEETIAYERNRYFVDLTECGYVIRDNLRIMPLPFLYFSRRHAENDCMEFNEKGPEGVRSHYYCSKVAGTGGKHPYKEWMEANKKMFE